ncbi:MAG: FeoA family protein [Bacilli bacterium]
MEKSYLTLKRSKLGKTVIIQKLNLEEIIKRRLLDIGLTPNTKITCILNSPGGDPRAYLIKGTLIAIRNENANKIIVKEDYNETKS